MAYRRSFKPRAVRRNVRSRRKSGGRPRKTGASLDKYVDAKVKQELSRLARGPSRSVVVRALPCEVDRTSSAAGFTPLDNSEWPAYLKGPLSQRKYALLPITELISSQRGPDAMPDDGQRPHDSVHIKGVCVRMSVCHAEGVRLLLFAFRNGERRGNAPTTITRPFSIVEDGQEVPRQVNYEVLTKEGLNGDVDKSVRPNSVRHLGTYDGPFRVCHDRHGQPVWKSTDETAFMSRLSKDDGKPVGSVEVRVDGGAVRRCGHVAKVQLPSPNLMRTFKTPGHGGVGADRVGIRYRQLEFYVALNQHERFRSPNGSWSGNERPLELFIGFDGPKPFQLNVPDEESVCATISAMDCEIYYV